jgi:hypothetical protein
MKKALWSFIIPILLSVLILPLSGQADDPVDRGHNVIYWEFVTATNIAAATNYYPSNIGFGFDGKVDLSVWFDIAGSVTMTVEASYALSLRTTQAAEVGDFEIYLRDSRSFADLEAGQNLRLGGNGQLRTIASVRADIRRVILTVALTSNVPAGTTVLVDPQWINITRSGYDTVNHVYDNASYTDATGAIDFDNLNAMRVRIVSVTNDATNEVNYKVRYK